MSDYYCDRYNIEFLLHTHSTSVPKLQLAFYLDVYTQFTILGIVSALAVLVPGIIVLFLIRGVKVPFFRNLTIMLGLFGILHGIFHILFLVNLTSITLPVDLVPRPVRL